MTPLETTTAATTGGGGALSSPNYPSIKCVLCDEWVCVRNRLLHIESHLEYRPYVCSECGYMNRKEAVVNQHTKRYHAHATVSYVKDAQVEKRVWQLAEQSVQHTKAFLAGGGQPVLVENTDGKVRRRVRNSRREAKSELIELFSAVAPNLSPLTGGPSSKGELQCRICSLPVPIARIALEEHCRSHCEDSYACPLKECQMTHTSRLFIQRHLKEVHREKGLHAQDLMTDGSGLAQNFAERTLDCFPAFSFTRTFSTLPCSALHRQRYAEERPDLQTEGVKYSDEDDETRTEESDQLEMENKPSAMVLPIETPTLARQFLASLEANCEENEGGGAKRRRCSPPGGFLSSLLERKEAEEREKLSERSITAEIPERRTTQRQCTLCLETLTDEYSALWMHAKRHASQHPYVCTRCGFGAADEDAVKSHTSGHARIAMVESRMDAALLEQCIRLVGLCFPGISTQPDAHDPLARPRSRSFDSTNAD